jgi:2-desacetyl-2-hydroxyethyl bacteriochlorophyllide A dehydrogenase
VVSFTEPRNLEIIDEPDQPLGPGDVRIQTLYSGISAGTELTAYRGTNPYLNRRWDPDLRLFVEGEVGLSYPVIGWGYEEVGEVVEVGADVEGVRPGDRVWGTWGHRTHAVLPGTRAAASILPPDVDPRIGIFSQIGAIGLNLVIDGDIHIGETAVIFGLGVPGQIAAQLARMNGAEVIAVDGVAERRELALKLGASQVIDPADGGVAERVRELTGGRGADVALEITGSYRALHEAIRSVAYNSRVCVGGFMQGDGAGLRLGEEFHHNRVTLVGSQISGVAPALQHRWDRERLGQTAMVLAGSERLRLAELISHTVPFAEADRAFAMLDEGARDVLQVVLDFGLDDGVQNRVQVEERA